MAQAVVDRARGVFRDVGPVHRLQREALEGQAFEILWRRSCLWVHQLQFVTPAQHELRAGLGTDAKPVHAGGRIDGAVGFDADDKAARMERVDQWRIDLQKRFAPVSTV